MDPTLLRAFLTLMTCVAAIALLMWYLKRRTARTKVGNTEVAMNVLARQQLSPKAHVCIVQVGERTLVLGVTDTQVSFLGDLHSSAAAQLPTSVSNASATGTTPPTPTNSTAPVSSVSPSVHLTMESLNPAFGPQPPGHNLPPDLSVGAYLRSLVGRNRPR